MNRRTFFQSVSRVGALIAAAPAAGAITPSTPALAVGQAETTPVVNHACRDNWSYGRPSPDPYQPTPIPVSDLYPTSDRYLTQPHMERRWDVVAGRLAFTARNKMEWESWHQAAEAKLKSLLGYNTMERAALNPEITEEVDCGDYTRQRVEIQTEPGVIMPMFVLVPKAGEPPHPAVICPHGHAGGGKITVAGIFRDKNGNEVSDLRDAITLYHYDYGVQFARAGVMAFCPDARGFGERLEKILRANIFTQSCPLLNRDAYGLGQTIAGMWTWDIHRLIDYIETRKDCRPGAVGCAGLSGGGLQTLYASALDPRIRCAVISAYMYDARHGLFGGLSCLCNFVPHLWEYLNLGDVAAMIAPRGLVVETGEREGNVQSAASQVEIMRRAYRLLGAEDMLEHDIFPGGHQFHGAVSIPFTKRVLSEPRGQV